MSRRPIIDAGPSLNFFSVNRERLLIGVMGPLSAPETVRDEVLRKSQTDDRFRVAATVWRKLTPRWIDIHSDDETPELAAVVHRIAQQPMQQRLRRPTDLGELMVIAHAVVAAEAGDTVTVLIDEGDGARIATSEIRRLERLQAAGRSVGSIRLAGTLTVLQRAAGTEHLPDRAIRSTAAGGGNRRDRHVGHDGDMALSTRFTELFGVRHPIASAPMGGSAGGALAGAVSRGGGLGILGGDNGDRAWMDRELSIVASATDRPWGIGFLTWAIDVGAVEHALEHAPRTVMLSFGDPSPYAQRIRQAGAALMIQVTDLDEARQAVDVGADVIVAQGTEAGGHGARRGRSALPFVPVVVDLVAPVPVLAAGGIADGRGVAAALALGAAGALIGTRFQATVEALVDPAITKAILEGRGQDTERSSVLDLVRGSRWPSKYTARTLDHPYLDRWRGREAELAGNLQAQQDYQNDLARGAISPLPVWAGEAVDLITDLPSAADLVTTLAAQAEDALTRAGRR